MSENWWQSEICIVINDKSQGSIVRGGSLAEWFAPRCCKTLTCVSLMVVLFTLNLQTKFEMSSFSPGALVKILVKMEKNVIKLIFSE